jgi:hypothetical protein
MKKIKLLSVLVAFAIIIGLVPTVSVSADSGSVGMDVVWDLSGGILTISGTGDMDNFTFNFYSPWLEHADIITSIIIEDGVTTIGDSAFAGLYAVTSVSIPDSVTVIGENAFNGCRSLTALDTGDGVVRIRASAFWGCTGLTEVRLGNALTTINNNAFRNCTSLTSIVIPDSVVTGFCEVTWENTGIGFDAFGGCTSLREVVLSSGITHIERNTFNGCTSLEKVTFPDNLEEIDNFAFFGTALTEIDLPESVTRIHNHSFAETSLTKAIIRGQISRIGWRAFADNPHLTEVHLMSAVPPMEFFDFVFDNSPKVSLIVPHGAGKAYREVIDTWLSQTIAWGWGEWGEWARFNTPIVEAISEPPFNLEITVSSSFIEVRNTSDTAVSTKGLFISNDNSSLLMWQMPAVIIKPGMTARISESSNDICVVLKRMQTSFDMCGEEIVYLTQYSGNVLYRFAVE